MPSIPTDKRESYADLAMSIFLKHPPADPRALRETREKKGNANASALDALLEDLGGGREQVRARFSAGHGWVRVSITGMKGNRFRTWSVPVSGNW